MPEIIFLTLDDVLLIHDEMFRRFHGVEAGMKDPNLVQSAIAAPVFKCKYDPDADLCILAAVLMHHLISNHGFHDANKRAGTGSAIVFLAKNGWLVNATDTEIEEIAVRVADVTRQDHVAEEELAEWFRLHIVPIEENEGHDSTATRGDAG
ncbi:MAG TPA: type II toxin-antitoxin system death-on-curing family toxin [Phycisphaerae bacterium]|nr:type II toxin-antitoxin system death-on-curing family toxin [Phycisphaerae bacterium]